jgi:hypothetical protein
MLNDDPTRHLNNIRIQSSVSLLQLQKAEEGPLSAFGNDSVFGNDSLYSPDDGNDDHGAGDDLIPSRDFLKQSCGCPLNDVSHKKDQVDSSSNSSSTCCGD